VQRSECGVVLRAALLGAADNRGLADFVTRHGRRFGAYRFVAGETLDQFMDAVAAINARGMRVAAGLLGEDVHGREDAAAVASEYCGILDRFAQAGANANVALKLTHLGLPIDRDLALDNVRRVVGRAATHGNFVRIDMEQSAYTDATLGIYRELREHGLDNVGTVLQSYLYRSEADLRSLLPLSPSLRLVKGAYLESADIAFPHKRDVDRNFVRMLELSLQAGGFTAIATHDDAIIEHAVEFIRSAKISDGRFEFQMLYGVRPKLQAEVVRRGHPLRIAVPFGSQWYPYFVRRLAERPANVLFLLKSMWRG
jgi:proline dehydrogenase